MTVVERIVSGVVVVDDGPTKLLGTDALYQAADDLSECEGAGISSQCRPCRCRSDIRPPRLSVGSARLRRSESGPSI